MSRKTSDGTIESEADYTIPRQGRKRKPAFAKVSSGHEAGGKQPASVVHSLSAPESDATGDAGQTGTSLEDVSDPDRRKRLIRAGAGATILGVVALFLFLVLGKERLASFDVLLLRSCAGFHGLPAAEKPQEDAAVALFAAACKDIPAGR